MTVLEDVRQVDVEDDVPPPKRCKSTFEQGQPPFGRTVHCCGLNKGHDGFHWCVYERCAMMWKNDSDV